MYRYTTLKSLEHDVLQCRKCGLSGTRHHVIFGEGNDAAPIFLIGEGPGRDEDLQGRPFVDQSGRLLDKILEACGFDRSRHVYIGNIIKCRPPGNRTPAPEEVEACLPYLLKQIDLVDPKIIILLGSTALKSLIGPDLRITRLRGTWITWHHRLVIPVYHPSALLRNPRLKKETWEDFKNIVCKYRELVNPEHHSDHV